MAAARDLQVQVSCDVCLDRAEPSGPDVERVRIAVGTRSASVDLCAPHRAELDGLLVPYLALARRGRTPDTSGFPRLLPGEQRETIRAWAIARGLPVARTGTLSAAVLAGWRDRDRVRPQP